MLDSENEQVILAEDRPVCGPIHGETTVCYDHEAAAQFNWLVRRASAGDRTALNLLVAETAFPRFVVLAGKHAHGRPDTTVGTEDVAQECCIRMLKFFRDARPDRPAMRRADSHGFYGLISRIAASELIQQWRHYGRERSGGRFQRIGGDTTNLLDSIVSLGSDPIEAVEYKEQSQVLLAEMDQLSEADRALVDEHFFQAQPYESIARRRGCSIRTCRRRMRYILNALRTKLESYYNNTRKCGDQNTRDAIEGNLKES